MKKCEKLSTRKARIRVKDNLELLLKSKQTIKDIFEISFSRKNFTLFNLVKYNSLTEITYKDAYDKVCSFASYFDKNIDKNEKYVGLLLENTPEFIYTLYGLLMSGHAPILLSTKASEESNLEILGNLNSHVVVSDYKFNKGNIVSIDPYKINEESKVVDAWADEIVFVTSGTSGKSKIILYTGKELTEQIVNAAGIVKNYPQIASTYKGYLKHLVILPFYHVFGFIAVFLWFSFFNTTFVLPSSLASIKVREAAIIGEPTHIFAVPLFWDTVTKGIEHVVHQKKAEKKFTKGINVSLSVQKLMPRKGPNFVKNKLFASYLDNIFGKSIQFCITGGSYISENTLRVINGLGYPLVNGYGSTEIGISSFVDPKRVKNRLKNDIGIPFDTFKYEVSKDNELLVKGNSTYHAILVDGKFVERDHASFISTQDNIRIKDKKYFIDGRMDEIFVDNNGENYSLVKIEQGFATTFASDVIAVPLKDNKNVGLIVSFNKAASDYQINYDIANIIHSDSFIKNNIKELYISKEDVEKANGLKIKRNLLKEKLYGSNNFTKVNLEEFKDKETTLLVNDEILNVIIEKMKNITHQDKVNKNSDFFLDLGGDSLSYYELVASIEGYFGVKFNLEEGLNRTPLQFMATIMEKI